jgi:predicted nucleotidyltransferase
MSKKVSPTDRTKSPNKYILDVIELKIATPVSIEDGRVQSLIKHIKEWAGKDLADIFVSGSSAKGTALKGSSDLDLFISLKSGMSDRLEDNFHSLAQMLKEKGIWFRRQNVSIRIKYHGLQIDLVPGKKKPRSRHKHTLYMYREETQNRIETNVHNHAKYVIESGRVNEILALKIWKNLHGIDFPSMYLEMYVIKALKGKWTSKKFLARNFFHVLEHMANYFHSTAIHDPSNGSNVISNDYYKYEKDPVQKAAQASLGKEYLIEVIS